jgi:hypothetical protein
VDEKVEKARSFQDHINYLTIIPFLSARIQAQDNLSPESGPLAKLHDAMAVAAQMAPVIEAITEMMKILANTPNATPAGSCSDRRSASWRKRGVFRRSDHGH